MSTIASEVYLGYPLENLPQEAVNPKSHHAIIVKSRPDVLACVGGFFIMSHPEGERDCPYDSMSNEEVMQSIVIIPVESFYKSMKSPRRYFAWSSDLAVRCDGLTIDRFIEHIITHETMHLVLQKLGEWDASHKFDQLSRQEIAAKIGHSPYYTLGVHRP